MGFRLSHQDRKCSSRPLLVWLCSSGEPCGGHLSGVWHLFWIPLPPQKAAKPPPLTKTSLPRRGTRKPERERTTVAVGSTPDHDGGSTAAQAVAGAPNPRRRTLVHLPSGSRPRPRPVTRLRRTRFDHRAGVVKPPLPLVDFVLGSVLLLAGELGPDDLLPRVWGGGDLRRRPAGRRAKRRLPIPLAIYATSHPIGFASIRSLTCFTFVATTIPVFSPTVPTCLPLSSCSAR